MAFVGSSIAAAQLSAQADDAPAIIADNLLRDTEGFWSSDGTGTGSDITDPSTPASWATDGHQHFGTRRTNVSDSIHRFVWQFASSVDFDSIYIKLIGSPIPTSVVFEIADNAAFSTNAVTMFTWNPSAGSSRLTGFSETRYTGTGWCRVIFNYSGAELAPAIGEIQIGQRRQLSRRVDQGSGYDDAPYGSRRDVWSSRGGVMNVSLFARGFSDFRGKFSPTGSDRYGLDDIATLRSIMTDSNYLSYPVVWVDRPGTALDFACFGFLEFSGADVGLNLPLESWVLRSAPFQFTESTPFARRDSRDSDT